MPASCLVKIITKAVSIRGPEGVFLEVLNLSTNGKMDGSLTEETDIRRKTPTGVARPNDGDVAKK